MVGDKNNGSFHRAVVGAGVEAKADQQFSVVRLLLSPFHLLLHLVIPVELYSSVALICV